jgi:hypothetical protein
MAALIRSGERNANDRVIRIERSLLLFRAVIDSIVCLESVRSSSSQRCAFVGLWSEQGERVLAAHPPRTIQHSPLG